MLHTCGVFPIPSHPLLCPAPPATNGQDPFLIIIILKALKWPVSPSPGIPGHPFGPIFSTVSYILLLPGRHFLFFLSSLPNKTFPLSSFLHFMLPSPSAAMLPCLQCITCVKTPLLGHLEFPWVAGVQWVILLCREQLLLLHRALSCFLIHSLDSSFLLYLFSTTFS